ncbi:YppG family protein [Sediminibacillus halophilus]|uniref:YppG-like protein n=1 Tax=Sediminibacillus halophilus TaxID=482461 RepID=A0A1G9WSM7_9BACI|nr:YppG family protein [Sediminibacillus halophilus]SDM87185.1 YppG-like protein [Sediminibacillus halophilus]
MNQWRAPYPDYGYQPYGAYQQPGQPSQLHPFMKPTQNAGIPPAGPPYNQFMKPPHPSPWPQQNPSSPGGPFGQAPGGGFIHYFQDKNGQMDIDKMLNTVGQMATTFQQVAPLFKGFGSFIKGIK